MKYMKLRKALLKKSQLYLILDKEIAGRKPLSSLAARLLNSGVDIAQLRDKTSDYRALFKQSVRLARIFKGNNTLFIVNDYIAIAMLSGADGVHLGEEDSSLSFARKILGSGKIIGKSVSNLNQALIAQREGADYLGFGPVFPTPLKPRRKAIGLNFIRQIRGKIRIPVFAIGGINAINVQEIFSLGFRRIALCRAILKSKNKVNTIKKFKTA